MQERAQNAHPAPVRASLGGPNLHAAQRRGGV